MTRLLVSASGGGHFSGLPNGSEKGNRQIR